MNEKEAVFGPFLLKKGQSYLHLTTRNDVGVIALLNCPGLGRHVIKGEELFSQCQGKKKEEE